MRTYVKGTIYNALPSDLRGVIAYTTVISSHGSSQRKNFTTTDKLYLLSAQEVWGENPESHDTSYGTSRQLDYYANLIVNVANCVKAGKRYNGSGSWWWLRSADYSDYEWFLIVSGGGYWDLTTARNTYGVSPAFRIA